MSNPWECPRCGRINAPFNPSCFCKPMDECIELQSTKSSEHIMDAARYLSYDSLDKIIKNNDEMTKIALGMMPNFYAI